MLSGQRVAAAATVGQAGKQSKELKLHPLVKDGQKIVPSVTRVFRRSQTLTLFAEVYPADAAVAATAAFFRGGRRVMETKPLAVRRGAVMMETALTGLDPGEYTVQVNCVDAANGRFGLARAAMVIAR